MANAVFNSVESYFAKDRLRSNVPYSKFDLSHIRSMDIDFGILYPFWIEDCLPGDRFKISNVLKLQALPLKNPLYNNIKLYTYYFFVPYYLLWHKFDRFIAGGRDGTYSAELPYISVTPNYTSDDYNSPAGAVSVDYDIFGPCTLWDYMGFQQHPGSALLTYHTYKVSAFPFAAYQRIFRDYFFNQDVQTSTNVNAWFPEDDFDFQLHDGLNCCLGEASAPSYTSGNPIPYGDRLVSHLAAYDGLPLLLMLRARNYNKDYFTSSMFSPQRGPLQALGANPNLVSSLVAWDGYSPANSNILRVINVGSTHQFGFVDGNNLTYGRDIAADMLTKLVSTSNFTVSDLHLAQQIELWMERNMSVKAQYNEFLRIHFNDAPLDERLTKPYYIGGTVQDVMVSQVMQTSQTTESSAQGTITGNAHSIDSDYVGTFHSHEYGLIMGICCVMPEGYYESGIDRHWTKTSRFDFYFPEFCDLEPQAILKKEYSAFDINDGSHASWLDDPLSYIGRYDEYRHHRSLAVGSLRNSNTADFTSWIIPRTQVRDWTSATNPPVLGQYMISTHKHHQVYHSPSYYMSVDESGNPVKVYDSLVSHDVWETGMTVNPFILQIGISCTAVRPLPYVPNPARNSY